MGDEIIIEKLEVIQNGLLQIDFRNLENNKIDRCFIELGEFFKMLGPALLSVDWTRIKG